jgi:hypothetical protein
MKLREIFEDLMGQEDPNQNKVVEFPQSNLSISFFKNEKKISISPIDGEETQGIRSMINQIKQAGFKVKSTVAKGQGTFELQMDQKEDFGVFIDYVQEMAQKEEMLNDF